MSLTTFPRLACLLLSFCSLLHYASASCYWPNGMTSRSFKHSVLANNRKGTDRNTNLPDNLYESCNPTASASMCCALDTSSNFLNANSGTKCRPDGLCNNEAGDALWRTACTDKTWKSPECVNLCVDGVKQQGKDTEVTQCDNGSYCCGRNDISKSCCTSENGVWLVNGTTTRVNPNPSASRSSSISAPTSSTTGSAAPSARPASSEAPTEEKKTNTGAIAGGVAGGVLGLAAIAVAGLWLFFRRRRAPATPPKYESKGLMAEAPADDNRKELPVPATLRSELGTSTPSYYELDERA